MKTINSIESSRSPNSRAALFREVQKFNDETDQNYRAMFHQTSPQRKPYFAFFIWFVNLVDEDHQFQNEMVSYLEKYRRRTR